MSALHDYCLQDTLRSHRALAMNTRPWLDRNGRTRIEPRIVYEKGVARVQIRVKWVHMGMLGNEVFRWDFTYYPVQRVPTDKRKRSEMLRNIAMMHAMQLGVEFRLRSKKI